MDRDLLRQCLTYHGETLFNTLKCEQTENPDFQAVAQDLSKATYERRDPVKGCHLVEQFIARKADILFCPKWKTATPQEEEQEEEEDEAAEPYAIMPPLELFMEVPYEEKRAMLYRDLERGDAVVGRINNIREYGFFLTLLCMAGGLERDIEDLELSALCHIKEIPTTGSHDDPLSYYQIGDFIRAGVKDIDRYQEKITVSLQQSSLYSGLTHIKLGVIAREELPIHYSRSLHAANTSEMYERLLQGCHGYHNPLVVEYLLGKVGVSDVRPPSLMRGLQSKHFQEEDFAAVIRKKQSSSWALKCVRSGVDHFKHGRHVEAMNEYNKALEIDTNNVEALVARGALYANKGSIMKAIADFELSLESCQNHRNAKKYLCQTLVERGKQLEEQEKLVTAEGLYRRALSLDDSNTEAQESLRKITATIQKSIRLREEALTKEQEKEKSSETSAEKLRKILKEEMRMKRKRKRSSSASPSSSSQHSSSSCRKSKKGKKKHRRSERGGRRRRKASPKRKRRKRRRSSSEEDEGRRAWQSEEEEEEWYPAPPNTSATFLGRQGERDEEEGGSNGRICQLYSLSAASEEAGSDSSSHCEGRKRRSKRRGSCGGSTDGDEERGKMDGSRKEDEGGTNGRVKRHTGDEEERKKKPLTSAEPECSRISATPLEYSQKPEIRHREIEPEQSSSRRASSLDDRRGCAKGGGNLRVTATGACNGPSGAPKKDLPSNLQDIFNQIAQFQMEKGVGSRK